MYIFRILKISAIMMCITIDCGSWLNQRNFFFNFPKAVVHLTINDVLSKIQFLILEAPVKVLSDHHKLVSQLLSFSCLCR